MDTDSPGGDMGSERESLSLARGAGGEWKGDGLCLEKRWGRGNQGGLPGKGQPFTPAPAPLLPRDSGVLVVLGFVGEKQLLLSKCNGCFLYGQESKLAVSYTIRSYRV